jgi:hypothetical protein
MPSLRSERLEAASTRACSGRGPSVCGARSEGPAAPASVERQQRRADCSYPCDPTLPSPRRGRIIVLLLSSRERPRRRPKTRQSLWTRTDRLAARRSAPTRSCVCGEAAASPAVLGPSPEQRVGRRRRHRRRSRLGPTPLKAEASAPKPLPPQRRDDDATGSARGVAAAGPCCLERWRSGGQVAAGSLRFVCRRAGVKVPRLTLDSASLSPDGCRSVPRVSQMERDPSSRQSPAPGARIDGPHDAARRTRAALVPARLVRLAGLSGLLVRRRGTTTIRVPGVRPAPDLVARDFTAAAPNRLWAADLTEIATWEDTLYLAAVIDCYSRRCVG